MFKVNDDLSIYVTRGDIVFFSVAAEENGGKYTFHAGDLVRLKVFAKKDCENVVLQKDFPVTEDTETVDIFLEEEDTKIGDVISKPTDYWYEVELNPFDNPQTIIGYDEDGAKVFKLFPEGDDLKEVEVAAWNVPFVDDALDMTSTRPVQNQAIASAVVTLNAAVNANKTKGNALSQEIAVERARITNLASLKDGSTTGDAELIDGRVDGNGATIHANIGDAIRAKTKADFELLEATKLAQPIIPFMDRLEIGFVQIAEDGLTFKEYTNYVRTKEGCTIHLDVGDKITCSNETRVYTGYLKDGVYKYHEWTSNFTATVSADYVMLFSNYPITDVGNLDEFLKNITISRADNYSKRIENLNGHVQHLLGVENTYLSGCQLGVGDATTTNTMRYSAKLESPVYAVSVSMPDTVRFAIQGYSDSKYTTKTYDSGWIKDSGTIVFENPNLHYVVIFIRLDSTIPTVEDKSNTTVMQSLSLTHVLDNLRAYSKTGARVYYDSTNDLIRSVAHRGLSDVAPENTTPAFVLAKEAGFSYVETDIQVTKDGKYVCVHDETISKYTNGAETGKVSDYTLSELQSMDFGAWKHTKWKDTRILTFEDFILLCKKLGLKAYVELKFTHGDDDVAYYLDYVEKMGMSEHCVWRGAAYNSNIRSLSDTAVLAYDASIIMTEDKVASIIERYAPLFFHNDASYVTREIVERCHNHGVRIEVYTVNDEETLERLASIGVDGITTDKLLAGKHFFESML